MVSVAFEAALLSVVGYLLLAKARAPDSPTRTEIITVNVVCVIAAAIFALFLDTHGRAPALAFVIAAFEPVLLAGIIFTRRMPAAPPPSEQLIEQRLLDCGLSRSGFTAKYEDYLQSIEIVITPASGARKEHFSCIRQAVEHEIVTFTDAGMQKAYSDYVSELLRPQMLDRATAELKKRGLLKNFPDRNSFASLELYAQALERHSGLAPNSALRVEGEKIVFDPPRGHPNFRDFDQRYSSLLAVIMFASARRDFKNFAFVGNEAFAEPAGSD